jgi:hypothetical protein
VVKCTELGSGEGVAVKVLKNKRNYYCQGLVEVKVMMKVRRNDNE